MSASVINFSWLLSFVITAISVLLLLKTKLRHFAMDLPNERSLHTNATPRTGGLAIVAGVLAAWFVNHIGISWIILLSSLVLISLLDDIFGLSVLWRLLVHVVIAVVFVYVFFGAIDWWIQLLMIATVVWVVNLYNFMDGSDGLAGGMALFGFSTYAWAAFESNNSVIGLMCLSIATANLAFLLFNFNPAKIFMGDGGSIPLGFLAASIGLYGWQSNIWGIWFPILVFSPFIIDATVTLMKRLVRGEKVWQAHRSHYYQRLVQMGLGHKKLAICEYILMAAVCASALVLRKLDEPSVIAGMVAWSLIYLVILLGIDHYWKRFTHLNALNL